MAHPEARRLLTENEYLALEHVSAVKHEFVDGEVYAMTGTSRRHNVIAGNIYRGLRGRSRPGECRTYMSDIKVRVPRGQRYYYPDVVVTCDPLDADERTVHAPCVIVEVTSPSTETTDRREKAPEYRSIPSLRAYLIVDQEHRHVTRHWRDDADHWWTHELWGDDVVSFPCPPGAEFTLDEIYEDT